MFSRVFQRLSNTVQHVTVNHHSRKQVRSGVRATGVLFNCHSQHFSSLPKMGHGGGDPIHEKDDKLKKDLENQKKQQENEKKELENQKMDKEYLKKETSKIHSRLMKVRSGVLLLDTTRMIKDIVVDGGSGSGFLLSGSMGATNAHVICRRYKIQKRGRYFHRWVVNKVKARFPGGSFFDVKILAIDTATDLALFSIPPKMVKAANVVSPHSVDPLSLGQRLFFIGSPGIPFCLKTGTFSTLRSLPQLQAAGIGSVIMDINNVDPNHVVVEIEALAAAGTSGSPVVDETGHVVAVIFGGVDDIPDGAGVLAALAVPIKCLLDLMVWESSKKVGGSIFVHGQDGSTRYDFPDEEEEFGREEDPSR